MEIEKVTYSEANKAARDRFRAEVEKHIAELKTAYDEYLGSDTDRSNRRRLELDQYLIEGCGERRAIYNSVRKAIRLSYPEPPKPGPVFESVKPVTVHSHAEAKEKGLKNYVIVTEGPKVDVPAAWKDPDIDWMGGHVTPITPTTADQMKPARMTEDGQVYYREEVTP